MLLLISHEQAIKDRKLRIIARGEHSDHSHVICGDADVEEKQINGKKATVVTVHSGATIKHLIESVFIQEGREIWTKEHKDINLLPGKRYAFVPQIQMDPMTRLIERVAD